MFQKNVTGLNTKDFPLNLMQYIPETFQVLVFLLLELPGGSDIKNPI